MKASRWVAWAAFSALLAVALGAFGAHGLKERLVEAGQLANWHTAVRYQMWHALALLWVATGGQRFGLGRGVGLSFLIGSALFSGSLYALALGAPGAVFGPITPLGGLGLLAGWALVLKSALGGADREPGSPSA